MTRVVYFSNETRQQISGNDLKSSLSKEQKDLVSLAVKLVDNQECTEVEKKLLKDFFESLEDRKIERAASIKHDLIG